MKLLLLDLPGIISAGFIGALILLFGGAMALELLELLVVFLVIGVIVTKYDYDRKRELAVFEHERSWENVIANGGVPALIVALGSSNPAFLGAYVGSLAAVMADKFASELGVLGGQPFSLIGFQRVKPGHSGAISALGLFASFDGGIVVGLAAVALFPAQFSLVDALLIGCVGFIGSMVDSVAGVFEERGIGNKSTTNILCAVAGAVLGFFLIA